MELKPNLLEHYGLTEAEIGMTIGSYSPQLIKSNDFFLKKGAIANYIGFVKKGMLRSFFYNDNADEITTNFYPSGSLIIAFDSFNNRIPAKEYIVAVEESELMVIGYERQKELYEIIPVWQQICKDLADQISQDMMARVVQFQTLSATERYQQFCNDNPEVIQKVPLRHIATYLGINNATLSRIRSRK